LRIYANMLLVCFSVFQKHIFRIAVHWFRYKCSVMIQFVLKIVDMSLAVLFK